MLAKAKREKLPLKVREPQSGLPRGYTSTRTAAWDPCLPMKKALVFTEGGRTLTSASKRLVPGVPAKKRESRFLLQDPPRTVASAAPPAVTAAAVAAAVGGAGAVAPR